MFENRKYGTLDVEVISSSAIVVYMRKVELILSLRGWMNEQRWGKIKYVVGRISDAYPKLCQHILITVSMYSFKAFFGS